ncbi:MAG: phosphatidylserine decarboxylase, partial [Pelobium sp.]
KEGIRPVCSPDDDNILANSCESAPFRVQKNVPLKAKFWIKGQQYSLQDMLDNDPLASKFDDGTVYQAFLSALSYHRWHSPVSGTILKAYNVYGSYYSEDYYQGFHSKDGKPDPSAPNNSQAYIAEVASRAIIFIESDNPKIGLMCFVGIGMAEVSSNNITVKEGQHVDKGDEIGMFRFGGSTHCLIFRNEVNVEFDLHGQQAGLDSQNIPVRSKIGQILSIV